MTVRRRAVRFPVRQLYTIFMSPPVNPPVSKPPVEQEEVAVTLRAPMVSRSHTARGMVGGGGILMNSVKSCPITYRVCLLSNLLTYFFYTSSRLWIRSFFPTHFFSSFLFLAVFLLRLQLLPYTCMKRAVAWLCFPSRVSGVNIPSTVPCHGWGADFTAALPVCALRGRIRRMTGSWTRRN